MNLCRTPPSLKYVSGAPGGNTVGTTEEWRSPDDITVALYVRATQCHVLLEEYIRPLNNYP